MRRLDIGQLLIAVDSIDQLGTLCRSSREPWIGFVELHNILNHLDTISTTMEAIGGSASLVTVDNINDVTPISHPAITRVLG